MRLRKRNTETRRSLEVKIFDDGRARNILIILHKLKAQLYLEPAAELALAGSLGSKHLLIAICKNQIALSDVPLHPLFESFQKLVLGRINGGYCVKATF